MTFGHPSSLGPYRILGQLGRGAMGVVYRAVDDRTAREVALKVVLPDVAADEEARARFVREAQAIARLQHRNIVTVHDYGVIDESPYIAMELLDGMSLAARLTSGEPLPLDSKLSIVIQLCEGLQFAHDCGVVHRDVKPANIWLLNNGGVKLLDFGIAKIAGSTFTRAGSVVGSAAYMSPEQLAGGEIDGRSDIFAAGGILYELLAGRRAFEADNITAVMHRILHETPPPVRTFVPDIAPEIETAVETAMEKEISCRYEQAADLGTDLRLAQYRLTEGTQQTVVVSRPATRRPREAPPVQAATVVVPRREVTSPARPTRETHPPEPAPSRTSAPTVVEPAAAATARFSPDRLLAAARRHAKWLGVAAVVVLVAMAARVFFAPRPATVFQFDITTTPAGATIAFDGQSTGQRTPATLTLASQPARIGLTLVGFEAIDAPISPGSSTDVARLTYTLRRLLRVRSAPSGATIFLDGRETGLTTPAEVALSDPTPSEVELRWSDRRRRVTAITPAVLESGELNVMVTGRPSAPTAEPPDVPGPKPVPTAVVSVRVTGGYPFDVTGCGTNSLAANDHELTVTAPCTLRLRAPSYFLDTTRAIDASSGRMEIGAPQLARVQLRSRYEWCTVIFGGRAVGSPPVDIDLVAGTYTATIQCPDRTYSTRAFPIAPGRSVRRLDEFLP